MKKGDICEAVITHYDFPNKGSFMDGERKVTIKGALLGQKVKFMVTKRKSGMAEGRLLEVLEKSPMEDSEPYCPYFGMCGGCTYQTMSYDNQLKLKEDMVKKMLSPVINESMKHNPDWQGETIDNIWDGIIPSPVYQGYRNKMEFTFGDECKDGPLALGLHKKGSFHDILNVSGCKIIGEDWSKILDYSLDFFAKKEVPFYHRMSHEGILRNLVVRQSKATGEFLINLVTSTQWDKYGFAADGEEFKGKTLIMEYVNGLVAMAASEGFSGSMGGILYTENDSLGDVVQSDQTFLLYGKEYITEEVMGLSFKISPFSFFQTNTKGCEVLYKKAREYIMSCGAMNGMVCEDSGARVSGQENPVSSDVHMENTPTKIVFDLYSGTGTIAQMMSPAAKRVIGIEIVEEAVEAAKENAKLNGLNNCEFIAGDVLKAIDLVEDKPDLIILDPPRDGINPKALEKILAFGVDEMVYISCKPSSLARDLEVITKRGYKVIKACAVDQFPGTVHVETVVLLSQRANDYINIDISLDEFETSSAEMKATYREIKEYIFNKYNKKIHNQFIAEVKRDFGIIEEENHRPTKKDIDEYNKQKRYCTDENRKLIIEALKYYKMI